MLGFRTFILFLYVSFGLAVAACAVPMILRKVGPNPLYGFRVPKTLNDPDVWYEANAYAGRCLFVFGAVTSGTCLALYFAPSVEPGTYAVACLVVCLTGLAVSVGLSFRHLGQLPRP